MTEYDKRITILGGRGMLGTDVAERFGRADASVRVLDLPEFDITNDDHLIEAASGSDIIIKVRVEDIDNLDKFVTVDLRNITGIEKTQTAIILNEL